MKQPRMLLDLVGFSQTEKRNVAVARRRKARTLLRVSPSFPVPHEFLACMS